jgi:hypothetical protein
VSQRFARRVGDSRPLIELTLEDDHHNLPDLTSATGLTLHLRAPTGNANIVLPLEVVGDPELGVVREIESNPPKPAQPGTYRGWVLATLADGSTSSYPNQDDEARIIELRVAPR